MSAGLTATWTPASRRASIFSAAVPLPPAMMAPGVAHPAPGRRGLAGDEADDGLREFPADVAAAPLPRPSADLADQDDRLGLRLF